MARNKRTVSASAEGLNVAFEEAQKGISFPPDIKFPTNVHKHYWISILKNRVPADWRAADLYFVSEMADITAQLRKEEVKLENEGRVITNNHGNEVQNPRVAVVNQLSSRRASLYRMLKLNLPPKVGEPSAAVANRAQAVEQIRKKTGIKDSDLLAKPPRIRAVK